MLIKIGINIKLNNIIKIWLNIEILFLLFFPIKHNVIPIKKEAAREIKYNFKFK